MSYSTEPAPEFLFSYSSKHAAVNAPKAPRTYLYVKPQPGLIRLTKMERLGGCLLGPDAIDANVRHAILEVIGVTGSGSLVEVHSKADAPNQSEAIRMLQQVKVEFEGNHLQFLGTANQRNSHCVSEFTLTCPRERAIKIRGVYSALLLSDLSGKVDVETTHARIKILNVGSQVYARVQEGIIDYSGAQGSVHLTAGWELNLNLTDRKFAGELRGASDGPIKVLIQSGFATALQADVAKDAEFICRANIGSQPFRSKQQNDRIVHTFGEGVPSIYLKSLKGPIVIDEMVP